VRQQIKWIAFAGSFLGLVFVGTMVSSLILFSFAPETWEVPSHVSAVLAYASILCDVVELRGSPGRRSLRRP
jgi:hypothetical protein